jgi:hypothetical protein
MQFGRPALSRHKYRLVFVTIRNPVFTLGVETDKANGADHFDDAPIFSNNQNRPLNKTRTDLFSKRESGAVFLQTKLYHGEGRETSAGSPQSRWQPLFQFP